MSRGLFWQGFFQGHVTTHCLFLLSFLRKQESSQVVRVGSRSTPSREKALRRNDVRRHGDDHLPCQRVCDKL